MPEPLKLEFRPGINRETTNYGNSGGWFACNLVRFRDGRPESIPGWQRFSVARMLGTPRSLLPWSTRDNSRLYACGTHLKYYILRGGEPLDITPIRRDVTLASDPFTTDGAGSTLVTVTDIAHGAVTDDFVTYSGVVGPIDGIPADDFNKEHQIVQRIGPSTYRIEVDTAATAGSVAGGGASVDAEYQINVGLNSTVLGTGWGVEGWGAGGWGEAATTAVVSDRLRLWSEDNFGEDVVFCVRDGEIFYQDISSGVSARAVELQDLPGAADAPTVARQVMVSDNDRHTIAFGCNDLNSSIQDKQLIRWADRENIAVWTPDTITSAGSILINRGSEIIRALETQREILVFTDVSLHSMRFIGAPDVFGQTQVGENVSLIAPNAVVSDGSVTYWMGNGQFYAYSGTVEPLKCDLEHYIFDDLTALQTEKITCGVNRHENEVWWFLPFEDNEENSEYVVYNYKQQIWYYGEMPRTAWVDSQFEPVPLAAAPDGYIYSQETGADDGSVIPNVPLNTFIESSDMGIGAGGHFIYTKELWPDISFKGSTALAPFVTVSLTPRNYPGGDYRAPASGAVRRSVAAPVEQYTKKVPLRLRGREISFKIEGEQLGLRWRQGVPRLDARADGRL